MNEARKLTDILDIEDSDLVLDSLDCFQPHQRMAIELFIVYCCGSNIVGINEEDILKPSDITIELIDEILYKHHSDALGSTWDVAGDVFESFKKMFINKE